MPHAADLAPTPLKPASSTGPLVALCLAILATFGRLLGSDFSWWDDQQTLHQNPYFNPPTLETLRFYWSTPSMGLYVPVTYTLWAAIAKVAYVGSPDDLNISLNPWLFHGMNVALHLASTAIVFAILRRLFAARGPAFLGALLFAVHPMQVESLAWISGMKDLLCWLGAIAVVWLYVRRVQAVQVEGRPLWASWEMPTAMLVLALAILSKPTAMVAPAALLAIDGLVLRQRWRRSLAELVPLFAISLAGAALARVAQTVNGSQQIAIWQRPFIVGHTYAFYLGKFCWPFSLAIDYGQRPTVLLESGWTYVRWLAPAAIGGFLFWRRRSLPWLALAGAIVVIGIAPVSGIATFEMQDISTTADHYVYFSLLGPAIAVAWLLQRWPGRPARAGVTIVCVALAARSFDQCRHWRDTFALFEQTMHVNPTSLVAQNNLAAVEMRRMVPRLDLAEAYARRAVELRPDNYYALQTFGIVEGEVGKARESNDAFERLWTLCEKIHARSLQLDVARNGAASMTSNHDFKTALMWAKRALDVAPDDHAAHRDFAAINKLLEEERARDAATRPTTTATTRAAQ